MMPLGQLTGESPANRVYVPYVIRPVKVSVKPGFRASKEEKCFTREDTATLLQVPAI